MADFESSDDTSSVSSLDEFDCDLIAFDEWNVDVEKIEDLVAIVRGYVNRSNGGENLDYQIQSLCHILGAHKEVPHSARARLNTYLATSNEGMDEARLDIASICIDQAIAESMNRSQEDRQMIQAWKKHIERMYTLLVPAHEDTPADGNSGYDGAADTTNQALGHDGMTGTALSYYERTHPLALCGSRACRNESCRAPTPAPAPTSAVEAAGVKPESPIQSQAQTASTQHQCRRPRRRLHLRRAGRECRACIEHLKQEALSKPTMVGKNAMAAAAERVEKKKETQRFAKAVPKSQRLKVKNAAYATGAGTGSLMRALSFRPKARSKMH
ncbi:hypothetical protein LTR10_002926 [Elasticomyces elasticus]|nr:hypothetical protein LTR10_002926 [Elasticomyces elasticus]KAK4967735.1 hypothetical protein LTR42_010062 [Elasticomyces elasticus]